jgi:hypothetical protein
MPGRGRQLALASLVALALGTTALPAAAGDGITPGTYRGTDREGAPRTSLTLKIKGNRIKVVSIAAAYDCGTTFQLGSSGFTRVKRTGEGGEFHLTAKLGGHEVTVRGITRDRSVSGNFALLAPDFKCGDFGRFKANRK